MPRQPWRRITGTGLLAVLLLASSAAWWPGAAASSCSAKCCRRGARPCCCAKKAAARGPASSFESRTCPANCGLRGLPAPLVGAALVPAAADSRPDLGAVEPPVWPVRYAAVSPLGFSLRQRPPPGQI